MKSSNELKNRIHTVQLKEEERAETVNESIFHSYLDNSLAPGWITDEDGHALFMNKLARQIWRLDETYRYKHVCELFPKQIAVEFLASDREVLDTSKPIAFVIPSIRIDGSPGFYMLHKYLLPLNTSKRMVAGQAIDITEEINMREELRKSNERFSYVAKAVSDCIWDWDIETGQVYRSEALMALTGYTARDIEGSLDWWEEKIHPKDRRWVMDKLHSFVKQGHLYCDAEYQFRCADNSYKFFVDKGYIIYHDGKPVRAIGVVHDITEKKKWEARLLRQKIQQQKKNSRAIIAAQEHVSNELGKELHDNVNQILASAGIMIDFAINNNCEHTRYCLGKSRQYVQLAIEELRKISKSLNTSVVKEMGLIKPVEEIITNVKLHRPVTVRFECEPILEQQLLGEQKLMIYRIIQEQTNNIIKYAEATEVSIVVKRKTNLLHLIIQDNGKGFDLKQVKRGIGLANIRNRVEAFNGSLNIITSPGQGCCLEITIPKK
jgi:PAS domain S-box-containing protein